MKPESELGILDLEGVVIDGPVKCGGETFSVGDVVAITDRWKRELTGPITRFERVDTKASATALVTYRKTPAYFAVVMYEPGTQSRGSASILARVGTLRRAS